MSNARITPLPDGPLLVEGLQRLRNSRGPLETQPKYALCRCGASANKPFCDGAHGREGFSSEKLPGRLADRREDYAGAELTIHDNRSVCAHAGVCTDRLPAVWRMHQEPWIDPEGAGAEEIASVVAGCPSGALALTVAGEDLATPARPPAILVAENGPYVVTGGPELVDAQFGDGASTERFTLCRCGASKNKPFCDGTHWSIEFRDGKN